jgi:AraC-like DNA-binding protein
MCIMRVLSEPQIIAGFIYQDPVDELPALMHCGAALCCRGHSVASHTHPGFEFLYLSRGRCHWQTAGHSYTQSMGSIFITYPGETHGTGPKPNPQNRHLWLGLSLENLGADGRRLAQQIRDKGIHLLTGCEEAEPLLRATINQVAELREERAEVVSALLHAFIALMSQRIALMDAGQNTPPVRSVLPYSFAVQRAIVYMRQNLDRRIELREFARAAAFRNVSHFCEQFRREVGITPSAYHVQLRLEGAREMLHQPAADITTAALEFGFSSSQHFSTLFRRIFGITPRQWKARGLAKSNQQPVSARKTAR